MHSWKPCPVPGKAHPWMSAVAETSEVMVYHHRGPDKWHEAGLGLVHQAWTLPSHTAPAFLSCLCLVPCARTGPWRPSLVLLVPCQWGGGRKPLLLALETRTLNYSNKGIIWWEVWAAMKNSVQHWIIGQYEKCGISPFRVWYGWCPCPLKVRSSTASII